MAVAEIWREGVTKTQGELGFSVLPKQEVTENRNPG